MKINALVLLWGLATVPVFAANPDLRVRLGADPTTLDWNRQLDVMSERLSYQLMEGLVAMNEKQEIKPALATSWAFSKDYKTLTFKIRKGVEWSDGQPLVAQQFVDSFQRLFDPKTGAAGAALFYDIVGAEEANKGKPLPKEGLGVSAPDASTVVVKWKRPNRNCLGLFDHPISFPIRKDLIEKYGDKWTAPENFVTLGAYRLKEWTIGKGVKLVRNPKYYGKKPSMDEAQFLVIPDDSTALNLFEQGQLDLLMGLPMLELPRLSKVDGYSNVPLVYNNFIGFNLEKAPFDNVLVRKAFAHATDTAEVARILGGGKTRSTGWIPREYGTHKNDVTLPFDPAKARELLKQAGYGEGGKPLPEVTLTLDGREENITLSEHLQQMWSKNLGVKIQVHTESWKSFLGNLRGTDPPQSYKIGYSMTSTDAVDFMSKFMTGNPNNYSRFKSPKFDELINRAGQETDTKKQAKLLQRSEEVLLKEEAAIIPLFQGATPTLFSPRVRELKVNGRTKFLLKEI